jgi:hypothetical protein
MSKDNKDQEKEILEEVSEEEVLTPEQEIEDMMQNQELSVDEKIKILTEKSEALSTKIINEPYALDLSQIKLGQEAKYIADLCVFVKTKLPWEGTDFIYVENIYKELEDLKKTYEAGEIVLSGSTITAFYQLQMQAGGVGHKDVKQIRRLVQPFFLPYGQCFHDNELYKKWGEYYQELAMQKDMEEKEKFEKEQLSKPEAEQEKPKIDIPRTLVDIKSVLGDINVVLKDVMEQQEKEAHPHKEEEVKS